MKNAAGLPPSLSHFVFCQYNFWGESDPTIVPPTDPDLNSDDILKLGQTTDVSMFTFNHTRTFNIPVTEEFMDVYKGVLPEYLPIVESLSGGPVIALEIRQQNAVASFRELCGPHDPEIARHLRPDTIR